MRMKIKSLIILFAVMLTFFSHVSFDNLPTGGNSALLSLNVCHMQTGGLAAHAGMQCVICACFQIGKPEKSGIHIASELFPVISIIAPEIDRPPIA